jgi:uncharacterized protein (TIGR02996 family)
MTQDEAFIRTIVESPGDDTPRLAYADWLDEQDDPRGPYLRGEAEWAQPWRSGERPADAPELRKLATGLDPVWVARVSRPPLGVCCEHFVMENSGPELSPDDLGRVEREFGIQLPVEYGAFLLNHNGGRPYPARACLPQSALPSCEEDYWFYPVGLAHDGPRERTIQSEVNRYRTERLPGFLVREPFPPDADVTWHWDCIPICQTPDMIFTHLLGVRGVHAGQMTRIDWSGDPRPFDGRGAVPSLARFLWEFRPPAEFVIPDQDRDDWDQQESPPTNDPLPDGADEIPF